VFKKKLQQYNAGTTVVQKLNQGTHEKGLYSLFGRLFSFFFGGTKKKKDNLRPKVLKTPG